MHVNYTLLILLLLLPMQTDTLVATLQVHDVILVCDDCPHTYRSTYYRRRPLFALTIRNKLFNKPDVENRTVDYYKACLHILVHRTVKVPIPAAARFKLQVCGRSLAGIAGSNPAGRMDVCHEWCVLSELSAIGLSLAQRSPTECVCVCS
jgi:hypothetical protein